MSRQSFANDELDASTSTWWLFMLFGLVSIAAGVVVLAKPENSLTTLAVIVGIFVLLDGVFDLAASVRRRTENRGMAAIMGVLGVVIGVLLIRHPIGGVLAIALLIGIWLIAVGVVRLVGAFEGEHRVWKILVALIEIAAGIIIVSSPPIGFATLALLTGIAFIANGTAIFVLGWMMHAVRSHASDPAFGPGVTA
jgi:uncharacterized membrane protein HdeD (DUF308 family)